jgi:hypothetical protein
VVEVYRLVQDFELLRVHMLARESMLVQVRIQLLSHLAVISLFFLGLGVWIPGTYMLLRVAGFLEGRLPGTCWLPGALLPGARRLLESL